MSKSKYTSIGGQALIEGIMMRGPNKTAMAVRLPDGSIDVSYMDFSQLGKKYKILSLPVIRGVVNFIESMLQGYKALMISAEKSGFAEEENEKGEKVSFSAAAWGVITVAASVLAIALAMVLFMYLPALLFDLIESVVGSGITRFAALFEGIIKLIILVCYMAAVSLMPDIKRVFMYHGAEHKTIFAYEHKKELTPADIRKEKRFHPRCGTSFLILMVLVSIVVSSLVSILWPSLRANIYLWVAVKLLMVPLICGIGYELIKICGRYDNVITRIISAPGMWLQRITTREPDDDMLEIAAEALKAVIPEGAGDSQW